MTEITLALEVSALSPIERVEVRNGIEVVETLRGFSERSSESASGWSGVVRSIGAEAVKPSGKGVPV